MRIATASGSVSALILYSFLIIVGIALAGEAGAQVTHSIVSTSEVATAESGTPQPLAIGETARLRMVVVLPESTTISLSFDNVIGSGLEYVAGSARVSYLADSQPSFNGAFAGIQNESTPSLAFPASRISFDIGTSTRGFDFGSIVNNDGDAGDELLIIEFDAVVADIPANTAGDVFPSSVSVVIDEGLPTQAIVGPSSVSFVAVEPALTGTATFVPDALVRGATSTLTVVVRNLAGSGATAAIHDLSVSDTLDAALDVESISVSLNGAATTFGTSSNDLSTLTAGFGGAPDVLDIRLSGLPVDGVATITVGVRVDPATDPLLLPPTLSSTIGFDGDSLDSDISPDDADRAYSTSASDDLNIVKPDLRVTLNDSADPIFAGAPMGYTATVQNAGTPNVAATNTRATVVLPAGFTASAATPSQGTCGSLSVTPLTCDLGTLAAGASANIVIAGAYASSTVSGTIASVLTHLSSQEGNNGDDGNDTPADNDDERAEEAITILRQVDLAISKSVGTPTPAVSEPFTYTLLATNTGPSDASSVVLSDSIPAGVQYLGFAPPTAPCTYAAPTLTCSYAVLAAGADSSVTVNVVADSGSVGATISNTANATASEADVSLANNSNTVDIVPMTAIAAVSLEAADSLALGGDGRATPGDLITYSFTVQNSGNLTLSAVSLSDSLASVPTCPGGHPIGSLAPGASVVCSSTYAITQSDIEAGQRANTVSAQGNTAAGLANADDTTTTTLTRIGSLSLDKTGTLDVGADGRASPGDAVSYSFVLLNTGNVILTAITVSDPLLAGVTCPGGQPIASLAPGAGLTCSGTYALVQADVDAGQRSNSAAAQATHAAGLAVADDDHTVLLGQSATLTLDKSGVLDTGADGQATAGDAIAYSVVIANTGNVSLSAVTVSDPLLGSLSCPGGNPLATLAPAASVTCTGSYLLTQSDIEAGQRSNTASVLATQPAGQVDASDTHLLMLTQAAAVTLELGGELDDGADKRPTPGDTIGYTYRVENSGNVVLSALTIADAGVTSVSCPGGNPVTSLAPGASITCTATHALTQAEIDAGQRESLSNVTATHAGGQANASDSANISLPRFPALSLDKTGSFDAGSDSQASPGDPITYSFTIANSGNVTLAAVTLSDPLLGVVSCPGGQPIATLAPGASATCGASYAVTLADVDAGQRSNTASVAATHAGGSASATDTHVTSLAAMADLRLRMNLSSSSLQSSQEAVVTLTVDNLGPGTATATLVDLVIPTGLRWVADDCSAGPPSAGTLRWNVGNLAPGAARECRVRLRIAVIDAVTLTVSASASSAVVDPVPGNSVTSAGLAATPSLASIPLAQPTVLWLLALLFAALGGWHLPRNATRR